MLYKIFRFLNNRFDDKEIAHMNSIILRMWYEYVNMQANNQDIIINLNQMNNFEIKYENKHFILIIFQSIPCNL